VGASAERRAQSVFAGLRLHRDAGRSSSLQRRGGVYAARRDRQRLGGVGSEGNFSSRSGITGPRGIWSDEMTQEERIRRAWPYLVSLLGCAGPSFHEQTPPRSAANPSSVEAPRVSAALMLTANDPLTAPTCGLATLPGSSCPPPEPDDEPEAKAPPTGHVHSSEVPVSPPRKQPNAPARSKSPGGASPPSMNVSSKARDPVCGMLVDTSKPLGGSVLHKGKTEYFCSVTCRRTFLASLSDGGTP
jgi:YHS domain-containing protein